MLKSYLMFLVIYFIIDMFWIFGAKKIHARTVESVQNSPLKGDMIPAIMYYLLAPIAYIAIIEPYAKSNVDAVKLAAIIGALMFGAFDLTNKAIFTNYPWSYVAMDMSWGIFSMSLATLICRLI
jgi:uncharacterized membrane protein